MEADCQDQFAQQQLLRAPVKQQGDRHANGHLSFTRQTLYKTVKLCKTSKTYTNLVKVVKESKLNSEELELVLKIFVGSGLVFLLPQKPVALYQLVHDYLVEFIRQREVNERLEKLKQEQEKQQWLQKWVVRGSVAAFLVVCQNSRLHQIKL